MEQVDARWRKSTFSGGNGGNCVEVGQDGTVLVRDTKQDHRADRTTLEFDSATWQRFLNGIK